MSGGNSNDGNGSAAGGGWGSKWFKATAAAGGGWGAVSLKMACAATATAAAVSGGGGWGFIKLLKVACATVATAEAAREFYVFRASSPYEQEVPFQAHRMSEEPDHDYPRSIHPHESPSKNIVWTKPELGWVKLNVHGSRVQEDPFASATAGCGGVLRNSSGTWLHGFSQKLDPSFDVHETELWGIFTGLQVAWDMGLNKLEVESDHDSAMDLVRDGCDETHPQFDIVTRIRQLLGGEWQVTFNKIPKDANRIADTLAYNAHNMPEGLHQLPSPPYNCRILLLEDELGVSF